MNKKRKILTVAALCAFSVIIAAHYCIQVDIFGSFIWAGGYPWPPLMGDQAFRGSLFALAVFYAGLFFLFGGKDAEPVPRRPRDWRRIKVISVILAGLVVILGLIAAIIDYHERKEATRQANIEYETSKQDITQSEIDLIDLRLAHPKGFEGYYLTGRIRNRAANNHTLTSIKLTVWLREKEGSPDIVGEQTVEIPVEVPPHQTRAIDEKIWFNGAPYLTQFALTCAITEIFRGSGWERLAPTPSPSP